MRIRFILLLFLSNSFYVLWGQVPLLAISWEEQISKKFERISDSLLVKVDYSQAISNQNRFEGDPFSTYIGVFGINNYRIDFHITAVKSSINDSIYEIVGQSKLKENQRPLTGTLKYRNAYKSKIGREIITFQYSFKEPGNIKGDGEFKGIVSIVAGGSNKPTMFYAESGDLREYTNVFVGSWIEYNTNSCYDCIFSINPSGLYTKLPFRDYLYKPFVDDSEDAFNYFFEFKDSIRKYGWADYKDENPFKTSWWIQE